MISSHNVGNNEGCIKKITLTSSDRPRQIILYYYSARYFLAWIKNPKICSGEIQKILYYDEMIGVNLLLTDVVLVNVLPNLESRLSNIKLLL